jgi:DNA-binding NtrC family response regulator
MTSCKKVLLLKGKDADTVLLRKALRANAVVTEVRSLPELAQLLSRGCGDYDALFCGWEIAGGTWHDALSEVRQSASTLPVVVVARLGGEKQWIEVLAQGAFDMIAAPYQVRTILYLLEHAAASKAAIAQHSSEGLEEPHAQQLRDSSHSLPAAAS